MNPNKIEQADKTKKKRSSRIVTDQTSKKLRMTENENPSVPFGSGEHPIENPGTSAYGSQDAREYVPQDYNNYVQQYNPMDRGGPRYSRPYRAHRGSANNYRGDHIFRGKPQRFSRGNPGFLPRGNHIQENFNGYRQNFPRGQFKRAVEYQKTLRREHWMSQRQWNNTSEQYNYMQAGRTQHTQNLDDMSNQRYTEDQEPESAQTYGEYNRRKLNQENMNDAVDSDNMGYYTAKSPGILSNEYSPTAHPKPLNTSESESSDDEDNPEPDTTDIVISDSSSDEDEKPNLAELMTKVQEPIAIVYEHLLFENVIHETTRNHFCKSITESIPAYIASDITFKPVLELVKLNYYDNGMIPTHPTNGKVLDLLNDCPTIRKAFQIKKSYSYKKMKLGTKDYTFPLLNRNIGESIECEELENWIRPDIVKTHLKAMKYKKKQMDPKFRQGLIRKISDGILPTVNSGPKLDRPNSLYPMFNEQHWHKTELIVDQELLTDEMTNLENNFIRIQAWDLEQFKRRYPHITQANTLYYRKTQFAHWYKHIGTWGRDNSKVHQHQVGKNSENTNIIMFFEDENRRHENYSKERYIKMYNNVSAMNSNLAWSAGFLTKEGWLRPTEEGIKTVTYGNRQIFLRSIPTMLSPLQPNLPGITSIQMECQRGTVSIDNILVEEIPNRIFPSSKGCMCTPYMEKGILILNTLSCLTINDMLTISNSPTINKSVEHVDGIISEIRCVELRDMNVYVDQQRVASEGINLSLAQFTTVNNILNRCAPNPTGAFMNDCPTTLGSRFHKHNNITYRKFNLMTHLGCDNISILEKEQNLYSDRCSNNLTIGKEKMEEIASFTGHISRLIPLFPSLPPNYQGKVRRIHDLEENKTPGTYQFSSLNHLIEQMVDNIDINGFIRCSNCFDKVHAKTFITHWNTQHEHELIMLNVADEYGTGQKVLSNLLTYLILATSDIFQSSKGNRETNRIIQDKSILIDQLETDKAKQQDVIEDLEQTISATSGARSIGIPDSEIIESYNSQITALKIEVSDFTITNISSKLETEKLRREKLSWIQEKSAIEKNLIQKTLELNNRIFHISQLEQELKEERNTNEDLKLQLSEEKQAREKAENDLRISDQIKKLNIGKLSMKIASLPETDHAILSSDQSTNSNPGSTRTADEDLLTYPRSASVTEDDSHAVERVQSNEEAGELDVREVDPLLDPFQALNDCLDSSSLGLGPDPFCLNAIPAEESDSDGEPMNPEAMAHPSRPDYSDAEIVDEVVEDPETEKIKKSVPNKPTKKSKRKSQPHKY